MDELEWASIWDMWICEVYDLSGSGVVSDTGQYTQVFCCSPKVKDRTTKKSSPHLLPFPVLGSGNGSKLPIHAFDPA
jgi:hypothetical protein